MEFLRVDTGWPALKHCAVDNVCVEAVEDLGIALRVGTNSTDVRIALVALYCCSSIHRIVASRCIANRSEDILVPEDETNVSFSCCDPCSIYGRVMCNQQTNRAVMEALPLNLWKC